MTVSTAAEPTNAEPWPRQHWSRGEWFYMWTKGLDPWRIAVLCRVPHRKVYDHIRTRITYHPELFGARLMVHDQPALPPGGLKKPKPSWGQRCAELAHFRQLQSRFPRGHIEAEASLYSFLQNQRRQYRAGRLTASKKDALDELVPGWLTPPKAEREHTLWHQRVTELESFVREQDRYPRYRTASDPREKVLAVWLERQRYCLRTGKLAQSRLNRINEAAPGWQSSRSTTSPPAPSQKPITEIMSSSPLPITLDESALPHPCGNPRDALEADCTSALRDVQFPGQPGTCCL